MRTAGVLAWASGVLAAAAAIHGAGCVSLAGDCELTASCSELAESTAGTGGNGGGLPPDCGPPSLHHGAPDPRCGIFAAPASAGGHGTATAPFASLQMAIDFAATVHKPVYACAKEFDERISVPSGVTIYGGLDCDGGWGWTAGQRTRVLPPALAMSPGESEVAARLFLGEGKTVLQDVDVTAPDGTLPGVSSLAMLIEDTLADLTRCTLTAGDGADGKAGDQLPDDSGLDGEDGAKGFNICAASTFDPGPDGATKACGNQTSVGGRGGDGGETTGTNLDGGKGGDGQPSSTSTPAAGLGGTGQSASTSCQDGAKGVDGSVGDSGMGAASVGSLSKAGYTGTDGHDGVEGLPGQGGGGGGGSKGKAAIACTGSPTVDRAGASGGSGGTGGCGGAKGRGGQAGGSSIALVSIATKAVTFTGVTLNVGKGGKGGDGGAGQNGGSGGFGQSGGLGSNGTANGCHGGDGGQGGVGGPGGGGLGGHAIGVAYKTVAPKGAAMVSYTGAAASPGKGGAPGANSTAPVGSGADGTSGDLLQLGP